MRIATVDQVAAIADRVPPRYRTLVPVAAFGGLRWGSWPGCACPQPTGTSGAVLSSDDYGSSVERTAKLIRYGEARCGA
jgi:hypothetical protein